MLIVNAVGPGVVRYFTDGRHPGRWSPAAERLLGLRGSVDAQDLRRVLQGRHPGTGAYLPDLRPHRRRGGWDLIFGAPKSLSLLAATHHPGAGIAEAHTAAVTGVVAQLDQALRLFRQGPDGLALPADGMVSAAFDHRDNAAGEPHIHTHVLVANLSCSGGAWGAVDGGDWFIGRSGLAALYHLELRFQLQARGWDLPWRLRPDGLADLADVPRAAVRAASTQSRMAVAAGRYAARSGATPQPWADRVARAGMPDRVEGVGGPVTDPLGDPLGDPELARKVSIRLTARRSDFRRWDVVVALASSHPGGATSDQALGWAEQYCRLSRSVPSVTSGERWTTEAARRADDDLVTRLRRRAVPPEVERGRLAGLRPTDGIRLGPAEVAAHLTGAGAGIEFLGAPPGQSHLLAQAEVIDLCRRTWEGEGRQVAVSAPTPEAAARWAVLAGLPHHRPGDRPDVLVVDRADRRTTSELDRLATGSAATLIFVEGGTLPRLTNPASHGLKELGDELGRHILSEHAVWTPSEPLGGEAHAGGGYVGRSAVEALLAEWRSSGGQPLLVGLGVEETRALNRAALALRGGRDPGVGVSGGYLPGDRLVVLKGRAGLPRYGTFGTVLEAVGGGGDGGGGGGGAPTRIAWDDGSTTETADRRALAGVGLGYAVTPRLAGRTDRPLMVLGPAEALGRARERVIRDVPGGLDPARRSRAMGF